MINLEKVVLIACDSFLWLLSAGCVLAAILAFIGSACYGKDMLHEKDELERKLYREMMIVFSVAGVAMIIVCVLLTMAALAVARGI